MGRREDLLTLVGDNIALVPLVEEMVELEKRLAEVKQLPFIKVHPRDPMKQKATPAAKLYKELLQQYTNVVRVLIRATGTDESDEESPLRIWVKGHVNTEK